MARSHEARLADLASTLRPLLWLSSERDVRAGTDLAAMLGRPTEHANFADNGKVAAR